MTQPESEGAGMGTLLRVFQITTGVASLGALLVLVAVAVRWFAFALDPSLRSVVFLAPALPWADLVFLGAQMLGYAPLLVLVVTVVSARVLAPQMARIRAGHRLDAAVKRIEKGVAEGEELSRQLIREALGLKPSTSRIASQIARLERANEQVQQAANEMNEAYDEIKAVPLPIDDRKYPVQAFGLAFQSRRVFIGFVAMFAAYFGFLVIAPGFPTRMIEQLAVVFAFGLLLRNVFSSGRLRLSTVVLPLAVAVLGASAAATLSYQLPVGAYELAPIEGSTYVSGRYAYAGESDRRTYLVACDGPRRVTAIPTEAIVRVEFRATDVSVGPSLWDLFARHGATPAIGALLACEPT